MHAGIYDSLLCYVRSDFRRNSQLERRRFSSSNLSTTSHFDRHVSSTCVCQLYKIFQISTVRLCQRIWKVILNEKCYVHYGPIRLCIQDVDRTIDSCLVEALFSYSLKCNIFVNEIKNVFRWKI